MAVTNFDPNARVRVDTTMAGVGAAAWLGWLPHIAAALSVIWFAICIYESKTFQRFVARLRMRITGKNK